MSAVFLNTMYSWVISWLVSYSIPSRDHLLEPFQGGRGLVAAPKMPVGRNQDLQAIEFRPWIGRVKVNLLDRSTASSKFP